MHTTGFATLFHSKGYAVQSLVAKGKTITVTLRRDKRFKNNCPVCMSSGTRTHKASICTARDIPLGLDMITEIKYPAVQVHCHSCGDYRTIRPSQVEERSRVTRRYMEFVSSLCRHAPVCHVASMLGHSDSSVREWDKRILKSKLPPPNLNRLRVLLVDEKSVRKGHHYVTVVMNGETREVVHMAEGAKKETLLAFLDRLNPRQKAQIRVVGIDRGGAYLSAIREALPEADIVFDRFHIIQNLNAALDEVRRSEYRRVAKKEPEAARLIKGQRFNLFRLPENRTEEQTIRLQALLEANEPLAKAHLLSEELRVLWTYAHRGYAERFLRNWVSMVEESGLLDLIRFARGLWRQREGVLNYIRHGITSGPLEAMNGTIERLIRRGCGVRDIEYLFLKIRQESTDLSPA